MGLFGELLGATIKVVVTPVALIKDVADTLDGQKPKTTETLVKGAIKDVAKGIDDLSQGKII